MIAAGTRIGPYEIQLLLGAGGMGEVYRARDTQLGRDVAIKVLPAAFGADADRLARFEREARVLASLNHPHIGAIYGIERAGGTPALVLELVDGETLAEHLVRLKVDTTRAGAVESAVSGFSRTGMPLDEALRIARQIVDALDAAHERGIVHRDLKPANIKITPEGVVKVLDFGLAKGVAESAAELTDSPTVIGPTIDGVLLGTAPYMSPEQARGKMVDKRTDIWAFGCVLYEMLTGKPAFPGETSADAIATVLQREPDWTALPAATRPATRRLLGRCLEKEARRRLRDIGDARIELEEHAIDAEANAVLTSRPADARHVQFQRLTDFVGLNESPAISPDGKMVAFVALVGGRRHVWIRLLSGGAPLQITRDDADHEQPRWAPDSSALIYYSPSVRSGDQGTISEISALGGHQRPVVHALGGGDISHDGMRIALFHYLNGRTELVVVARDGSRIESVRPLPGGEGYSFPRWSPDDRSIAFQGNAISYFDPRIYIIPSSGGESRQVARGAIVKGIAWLPDGSGLVYSSSAGSTVPYPPTFNLRIVGRDGEGDRQVTFGDVSHVEPDVHQSGKLLACRVRSQSDVWKFSVTGSPSENTRDAMRITRQTGQVQTPSVSPDGQEIVYLSDNGGHGNLWVAKTDGSSVRQITFERDPAIAVGVPMWSRTGNRITFILNRMGQAGLWLINPDGSGLRLLVARGIAACWSGDGQWLYYTPTGEDRYRIEKVPAAGGTPVPVRDDDATGAAVAPDGTTLYYLTRLTLDIGPWDLEIRSACPENGASRALTRLAGSRIPIVPIGQCSLSPDGRWLAMPLIDGVTSNLWVLSTGGGHLQPVTDFGQRPIMIARQVSWSPDSASIYAAVAEIEADVILLDGLLP